jgi:hypothetical protein
MSLRLPGWLLLAALVAIAAYGIVHVFRSSSSGGFDGNPARIELLSSTSTGGIFAADVILESRDAIADPAKGWTLNLGGGATSAGQNVPLAAAVQDTGNRNTHALRVHLFGALPAGAVASGITFNGPGNQFTVGTGLTQPGAQP